LPRRVAGVFQVVLLGLLGSAIGTAQSAPPELPMNPCPDISITLRTESTDCANPEAAKDQQVKDEGTPGNRALGLPRQMLHDQIGLWTSPRRIRLEDATWLIPLGGLTAAMIATDSDMSRPLSNDPNTLLRYRHISDYGVGAMAGVAGGAYLFGLTTHNEHQRETGFLSGESALDSVIIVEAMKYVTGRERPGTNDSRGRFWQGGTSLPSTHAAVAWSVAGVLAHEYPSPFVRFLAYGAATAVSASRIQAKQHFPSDALIGSALGWLVGEYVYGQHHDPALQGRDWSVPAVRSERSAHWDARNMASPYVPLDSWIYPSLERLIALGYIATGFKDMRPWTRMACAQLVLEAQDQINEDDPLQAEASQIYRALQTEFSPEVALLDGGDNVSVRLESAYSRSTEIAGKPLTDGYHFAQTIFNDYGRPDQQGFNNVSGVSGWAEAGPFGGYIRVEYQHAGTGDNLPLAARQAMAQQDFGPDVPLGVNPDNFVSATTATPTLNQAHLLDAYVAMTLSDWQMSYGKQSLWWGPGRGGSMMFTNNADPINMFRVNRVTPFRLPSFLGWLGPMRMEFFVGQLSGYQFVLNASGVIGQWGQSLHPQPIIHGERLSFKPTENLEFGFSRTTDYGGPGYPLTPHSFLRSVFSTTNAPAGSPNKPGDRRSGMDVSYRIPGFRNRLTFYCDGFVEDEYSPLVLPDADAWSAGLYFPRFPKVPKLDFRVEGVYTDPPGKGGKRPGYFYYDSTWLTGYQNAGDLLGSWIGRGGQGAQAWSTYWLTPKNKIEFSFRHQKISNEFVPGGGTLVDAGVRADFWLRSIFSVSASVQYEAWTFPVIASNRHNNVTSMVQLAMWPKSDLWRKRSSE
jgi:Capsule assembly protein Wzi/PAP2 superfamily